MAVVPAPTAMDRPVQPMLHAASLDETIRFYVDVLGFTVESTWPEGEPTWCALVNGPARLMFTSTPSEGALVPALTGTIYLYPADVDALAAALPDGTVVLAGPRDEAWGMRELALEDPNGYLIKLGQPVAR